MASWLLFRCTRLQPFYPSNRKSSGIFRGLTGTQMFTRSRCALQSVSWNEATAGEFTSNTWVSISREQFDFCVSHILHLQNSSDELQTNTEACEEILNIAEDDDHAQISTRILGTTRRQRGLEPPSHPLLLSCLYCQLYILCSMSRIMYSALVSFRINTCNHRIGLEPSSTCTTCALF